MLLASLIFSGCLQQKRNAIRKEALYLIEAHSLEAPRVAMERQREANSWSIARYWRQVMADVIHHSRPEIGDVVSLDRLDAEGIESARERRVRAQELARAIEFASTDDVEHRAGTSPEECCWIEDAALPNSGRRPATKTFLRTSRPLRVESRAGAAEYAAGDRIKLFQGGSRQ